MEISTSTSTCVVYTTDFTSVVPVSTINRTWAESTPVSLLFVRAWTLPGTLPAVAFAFNAMTLTGTCIDFTATLTVFFSSSAMTTGPIAFIDMEAKVRGTSRGFAGSITFLRPSAMEALSGSTSASTSTLCALRQFTAAPAIVPFEQVGPMAVSFT